MTVAGCGAVVRVVKVAGRVAVTEEVTGSDEITVCELGCAAVLGRLMLMRHRLIAVSQCSISLLLAALSTWTDWVPAPLPSPAHSVKQNT